GKPANDVKFAYITNAADPYPPENRSWIKDVEETFKQLGLKPERVDLRQFRNQAKLEAKLKSFDVIWCGGGNTWYLRYIMKASGFDQVIKKLLNDGMVYGGDRAGSIVS